MFENREIRCEDEGRFCGVKGHRLQTEKWKRFECVAVWCCRSVISRGNDDLSARQISQHHTSPVSSSSVSHLKIDFTVKVCVLVCVCVCVCVCVSVCLSPPLLVEEAGEGLTADLFGEVIFPPQNTVSVLLVVPLTGGDVRALRDRQQININTTVFNEMRWDEMRWDEVILYWSPEGKLRCCCSVKTGISTGTNVNKK